MRGFTSHSNVTKKVNKQVKGKLEILSSIRVIEKKSRETREVAYTSRYTSEHLIPNSVLVLGIDWIRD